MDDIGYPLLLQPRYDEKLWGGRRLETVLGKTLPTDAPVGESLESGDSATVANGPLAGQTLGELAARYPAALLGQRGERASEPFHDFPLLVKFIDATDILSLQVHPDDDAAAPLGKRGKTEAWHIIHADPGATLITGLHAGVTAQQVREAIAQGTFEDLILREPVRSGDTLIVPAGTVHAIDAGILLYEIQENSDITYRLYDWGRVDSQGRPREVHVDDALRSMVPGRRAVKTVPLAREERRSVLAACRYFTLERWSVQGDLPVPDTGGASFWLLSTIAGECAVRAGGETVPLAAGQTVLLPACLSGATLTGEATVLAGWIADLAHDVVGPLLDAGHDPEQIGLLGGATGDLLGALALAQRERARPRGRS